jgi:hypothetical protein
MCRSHSPRPAAVAHCKPASPPETQALPHNSLEQNWLQDLELLHPPTSPSMPSLPTRSYHCALSNNIQHLQFTCAPLVNPHPVPQSDNCIIVTCSTATYKLTPFHGIQDSISMINCNHRCGSRSAHMVVYDMSTTFVLWPAWNACTKHPMNIPQRFVQS